MGLNIGAYLVLEVEMWQEGPATFHEPKEEKVQGWESWRYDGDSDVPVAEGVEWLRPEWDDTGNYHRPQDLNSFELWVKAHIQPHLQPRWLKIIHQMSEDSRIWLYFGW